MKNRYLCFNRTFIFITAIFVIALGNLVVPINAQTTPTNIIKQHSNLLQFRVGDHVLGFSPYKAYMASMDHVLVVQFLGTRGVVPRAEMHDTTTDSMTQTSSLGTITYQNLWDGISLTYESITDGIAESTYKIAAGANVSNIRLHYNVPVMVQKDGSLKLKFATGYLKESAPKAWQEIDGKRRHVNVAFHIEHGEVGFIVGSYDPRHPLIIDPTYSWNTFYGGTGTYNYNYGMALDSTGDIYVTGWSNSTWTGPNNEQPLNPYANTNDLFVLKLDKDGAYKWHTFYGNGSSGDAIALDGSGNVYIAGYSYATWNGPAGEPPLHSSGNIHVLKLDRDGAYQWHTFYGNVDGKGIAVDSAGNIYVAGYAYYNWYGPEGQSPMHAHPGGSQAIFVLKLDSSGGYLWHTFYGTNSRDSVGNGITLDRNNNLYITGYGHQSWNGPNGEAPRNPATSDDQRIFVLKLSSDGTYQWHTFYGADIGSSAGYSIAADSSNNVYLTGYANSGWNGPAGSLPLNNYSGNSDFFVLKLDSAGSYQWHTFYGSNNWGYGITVSNRDQVYVTGIAYSTWTGPSGQPPLNGTNGLAILGLDKNGAYQWHAFYGSGTDSDTGYGIAVDYSGNIFCSGHGNGTWGTPLHPFSGSKNIFVLKMELTTCLDHPVKIGGTSGDYPSIGEAYGAMNTGQSILLQAMAYSENPILARNIAIMLQGGYECGFISHPAFSTLNGSLTISGGAVTIENIIIQ